MSIFVNAAGCQTWFDQTLVSVVLVPTTVFAQKIHKGSKIPLVIFSLGKESCQTVFSGVLPGVESIILQKSQ